MSGYGVVSAYSSISKQQLLMESQHVMRNDKKKYDPSYCEPIFFFQSMYTSSNELIYLKVMNFKRNSEFH